MKVLICLINKVNHSSFKFIIKFFLHTTSIEAQQWFAAMPIRTCCTLTLFLLIFPFFLQSFIWLQEKYLKFAEMNVDISIKWLIFYTILQYKLIDEQQKIILTSHCLLYKLKTINHLKLIFKRKNICYKWNNYENE